MTTRPTTIALLLAVLPAASLGAQPASGAPQRLCLAPATTQMASGNNADAVSAVRETFAGFLAGPTLSVAPLAARLTTQAREEARQASCRYVVFTALKLERSQGGGGFFGKVLGGAMQSGASEMRGVARSATARVAADAAAAAAAEAARGFATNVKSKDQLTLDYRVETLDGAVVVKNTAKAKASSDGQDLLTPMAARAAEQIANAVANGR